MGERAGHETDRDPPAQQARVLLHGLPDPVDRRQRRPRVRQYGRTDLRRSYRTPRAVQQRLPQFPLQLPYLRAEPRLREVQPFGGPGETGLLHHRHEVAQLPQLHNRSC